MILGALRKKTRIFVTHQLDLLHRYEVVLQISVKFSDGFLMFRVDKIIVMKEGKVVETGTYDQLMEDGTVPSFLCFLRGLISILLGLEFSDLVKKHVGVQEEKTEDIKDEKGKKKPEQKKGKQAL